jgi:Flp pilus assembly protein TadG
MQWLRLRKDPERGATAVIVALLMVPLIGFAAISIDVAAMNAERQQLQTGADAGALAIAQDCAREACGVPGQTAQNLAVTNSNDGDPTATVTTFDTTAGKVTVSNKGTSEHWFAPVLGLADSSVISVTSSARWGYPTGGKTIPLALGLCEWRSQTNGGIPSTTTPRSISLSGTSGSPDCLGPSGNLPGGFGWLNTGGNGCQISTSSTHTYDSDPGVSASNGCKPEDFVALQNATVLLPIFDERSGGTGSNAKYRVYGYAAFKITGYDFTGQFKWNSPSLPKPSCSKCISGYFTQFVDLTDAFNYSPTAPKLGAAVVALTG